MFKFFSSNKIALEIVKRSIFRNHPIKKSFSEDILIFISPDNSFLELMKRNILKNKKIMIFGFITDEIATLLEVKIDRSLYFDNRKNILCIDQEEEFNSSDYYIEYEKENILSKLVPYDKRYFTRFDFMDEWNNHGYGRIDTKKDMWSVSHIIKNNNAKSLAQVYDKKGYISEFITLTDFKNGSILYINREVGLVDGLDWNIIEFFLVSYRENVLPVVPIVLDLPYGYDAVIAPRLDCDQSIENTKPLVELYKSFGINLSLAIATGIHITKEEIEYLNYYYDNGGSLLSHTINHYLDWGDCYKVAENEAIGSKLWLETNIKNLKELKYAVSPFHTNKPYSVEALYDSGYKGFISGIIHNDPEYLISISGQVPFTNNNIVSHSQQCMLHGDCFHRHNSNDIEVYKEAFEYYYKAKKIFGYLDHPFGDYHYGWKSEKERLKVHKIFIEYINTFDNIKWITSEEVLDFIYDKSKLELELDKDNNLIINRNSNHSNENICLIYQNKEYIC